MLWTPHVEFQSVLSNFTTRPSTTAMGTSVTPGASNVEGSWTQLLAGTSVTHDCFGIWINANNLFSPGRNRSALLDIGLDPTDTSTFAVAIEDLLIGHAASYNIGYGGGHFYYFPLFILAGTQIGARVQGQDATPGTVRVWIKLFGKPKHPELVRAGSYVTSFGAVTASSKGTDVTAGQASEGAYTDLSGADTTLPYWWWQVGFGYNLSAFGDNVLNLDLGIGDGSNKHLVINDWPVTVDSTEAISRHLLPNSAYSVAAGVRPYGRAQASGIEVSINMMAYGLGG